MQITHIMADGSVRESVKGVKIPNKTIKEIRSKKNENQNKAEGSKGSCQ